MKEQIRRFALEYLIDGAVGAAASRAGYSKRSAQTMGSRLLKRPDVQAILDAERKLTEDRMRLTKERILDELRCVGLINPQGLFDKEGALKSVVDMPPDIARAISGIEQTEIFTGEGESRVRIGLKTKLKLTPKTPALELAARMQGYITDKMEVKVPKGMSEAAVATRVTALLVKAGVLPKEKAP